MRMCSCKPHKLKETAIERQRHLRPSSHLYQRPAMPMVQLESTGSRMRHSSNIHPSRLRARHKRASRLVIPYTIATPTYEIPIKICTMCVYQAQSAKISSPRGLRPSCSLTRSLTSMGRYHKFPLNWPIYHRQTLLSMRQIPRQRQR